MSYNLHVMGDSISRCQILHGFDRCIQMCNQGHYVECSVPLHLPPALPASGITVSVVPR